MTSDTAPPIAGATTVRSLRGSDLDAVVAIDRAVVGRLRHGFYQKRLAHLERDPSAFVALAAERGGALVGFVLARLYEGEFGGTAPEAALDAIGVTDGARGHGVARMLMAALETAMAARGIITISTEAEWTDTGLLGFFAHSGFALASDIVLDRAVAASAR